MGQGVALSCSVFRKPETPVEMIPKPANSVDEYILNERTKRKECWSRRCSDWSNWCGWQAQPLFLLHLSEECVGSDIWPTWDPPPFSRIKAFAPRPASATWDSKLVPSGLWGESEGVRGSGVGAKSHRESPTVGSVRKNPYAEDIVLDCSVARDALLPVLA